MNLRTKDHPAANGREPQAGEHGYTLKFPLDDGSDLELECGSETFARFSDMIGRLMIDDATSGNSSV